jgi:hypothetical protein
MREITFFADQWDIDENRQLHLDQIAEDGWEVVDVRPVPNKHEYVVTLRWKDT